MEEIIKDISLKEKMDLYRKGLITLPDEYIKKHYDLAKTEIEKFDKYGFEVTDQEMRSDGWGDGFKVLHATLIDRRDGQKYNIRWHDGNEEFFYISESGGSYPLSSELGFRLGLTDRQLTSLEQEAEDFKDENLDY